MKILVACEESQRVCEAFRKIGHDAFSCDVINPSGNHPEWHIKADVLPLINGNCEFKTMDGEIHELNGEWDMLIAFPPCTYLTVSGNRWFNIEKYGDKAKERIENREKGIQFFMEFANANCSKIAIENPIGCMSTRYRKPDQIIQPWMFGHPTTKATCLWLKGLPNLEPTNIVEVDTSDVYSYVAKNGHIKHDSRSRSNCKKSERAKFRSKTFLCIAEAMAEQWG